MDIGEYIKENFVCSKCKGNLYQTFPDELSFLCDRCGNIENFDEKEIKKIIGEINTMINLEELRRRKKELKITNKKISEITNIPLRTIEAIMVGKTKNPRIDTIKAIEKALNIDKSKAITNEKEVKLLYYFNKLIPPMQDYILEMIEKLTDKQIAKNENERV